MRTSRGPFDRRLLSQVPLTRRYLVVAVGAGTAAAAAVVAQAVLLASVVSASVLARRPLGAEAPTLVALAATFAARSLLVWGAEVSARRTSATVTSELRRRLLVHAVGLGPTWLAGERSGELSVTATRGIRSLEAYFGRYLPQALTAAVVPLLVVAWVLAVDWPSALLLTGLVCLLPPAMASFGRRARSETDRQWRRLSSLAGRYLELVQGLGTLRALGQVKRGRREVAAATDGLRRSTLATLRVGFLSSLVLDLLAGLGVGLVAMVLGLRLLAGQLPLATALAVLLVAPEVFVPLRRAAAEFHASTEGMAASVRILDVLDEARGAPTPVVGRPVPDPAAGAVALEEVTVAYPGRGDPALERLCLEVAPGEHVVVTGPSGSGKSTLLAVLLRFVVPSSGKVLVAGVDLAEVDPEGWRERLAWVPQRPHLFRGTLAQNVALGRQGAPEEAVAEAMAVAGLDEVAARLPEGPATMLGEGGVALSPGERQRVALARAVLRDAPLVLMDEPVGHLDPADVAALRPELDAWLEGRSAVVATHAGTPLGRTDRLYRLGDREGAAGASRPEGAVVP